MEALLVWGGLLIGIILTFVISVKVGREGFLEFVGACVSLIIAAGMFIIPILWLVHCIKSREIAGIVFISIVVIILIYVFIIALKRVKLFYDKMKRG